MIESVGQKMQIDGQIWRTNHAEFVPSLDDRTIAAVHSGREVKIDEQKLGDASTPIKFALAMSSRAFGHCVEGEERSTKPYQILCGARSMVVAEPGLSL